MQYNFTEAARGIYDLEAQLKSEQEAWEKNKGEILAEIGRRKLALETARVGLDGELIALAKTVIHQTGTYAKAGQDRESVIRDAMKQIATGTATSAYSNLWRGYFGTKSYSGWYGQREDHEYGYGPRHGSTIFSIGLKSEVRKREPKALTEAEINACVYYLANIERIEQAQHAAAA